MSSEANPYIVEIQNCRKEFFGVTAVNDVSIKIKRGGVHAVIGENGAGKSTIMKVLAGIHMPDGGSMLLNGRPFTPKSPADAIDSGISMIHQELDLIPDLTVADNIFAGKEITNGGRLCMLRKREMLKRAKESLMSLHLDIDPAARVNEISVAQMQMVAIVKATAFNANVIIMDEPTSAISNREIEQLFGVIDTLKKQDKTVIYISHKLEEISFIADTVTVMRDGSLVATKPAAELTREDMVRLMVGRELKDMYVKDEPVSPGFDPETVLLSVSGLTVGGLFRDISFSVKRGEILGVSGLMGAGRTEIMETVFGLRKADAGGVEINGRHVKIRGPKTAIKNGLAFITEDRKLYGLNLIGSIKTNISAAYLAKVLKANLVLDFKKEVKEVDALMESLKIKATSREMLVNNLSGGNQQKVVVAKWLLGKPGILIMDEPTRGIDIGAKAEIYHLMDMLAKQGNSIILVSSEMPELLGMSDRIIVIHEGSITGEFLRDECDQETLMACAVGGSK